MSDQQTKQTSSTSSSTTTEKQSHPAAWATTLNQAENAERDSQMRHSSQVQDNARRVAELVKQAEGGSEVQVQVTDDGIAVGNVKLHHAGDGKCELVHEHGSGCA